jgi:hypothetical protein
MDTTKNLLNNYILENNKYILLNFNYPIGLNYYNKTDLHILQQYNILPDQFKIYTSEFSIIYCNYILPKLLLYYKSLYYKSLNCNTMRWGWLFSNNDNQHDTFVIDPDNNGIITITGTNEFRKLINQLSISYNQILLQIKIDSI